MTMLKILHVIISVEDMEESINWYRNNLGLSVTEDAFVPPLSARRVIMEADGISIELVRHTDVKPMPEERSLPKTDMQTAGTKHIAFETDDMDGLLKRLNYNGAEVVYTVNMGKDRVAIIRDCNGIPLEIVQNG